jgi:hypothetical protein
MLLALQTQGNAAHGKTVRRKAILSAPALLVCLKDAQWCLTPRLVIFMIHGLNKRSVAKDEMKKQLLAIVTKLQDVHLLKADNHINCVHSLWPDSLWLAMIIYWDMYRNDDWDMYGWRSLS